MKLTQRDKRVLLLSLEKSIISDLNDGTDLKGYFLMSHDHDFVMDQLERIKMNVALYKKMYDDGWQQ